MYRNYHEVEVLINSKPAKEYYHKGRTFIEGRKGTQFSIRLRNNSHQRKLFVPTIDGLSVMNGEEGSFSSGGYIVQGNSSITIDGWRTSDKEVAEFFFSSPEGSYRKQMKRGNNLGIIGVAVFDEYYVPPTFVYTCSNNSTPYIPQTQPWFTTGTTTGSGLNTSTYTSASLCGTGTGGSGSVGSLPVTKQALGTGWGEQKLSEVTAVNFEREESPSTTFEIYYNTREELEKEGITFKKAPLYVTPSAFPGQYCRPPKN